MRDLEKKVLSGEISYSRMVEILNETCNVEALQADLKTMTDGFNSAVEMFNKQVSVNMELQATIDRQKELIDKITAICDNVSIDREESYLRICDALFIYEEKHKTNE